MVRCVLGEPEVGKDKIPPDRADGLMCFFGLVCLMDRADDGRQSSEC